MKVAVANDHRGIEAKEQIKAIVTELGHTCIDVGTNSDSPVDYPDMAYLAAKAVAEKKADRAILVCGTGIGMCIAANKVHGVRAALCCDAETARGARQWNDANILVMSLRLTSENIAKEILDAWFSSKPEKNKKDRLEMLKRIEKKYSKPYNRRTLDNLY